MSRYAMHVLAASTMLVLGCSARSSSAPRSVSPQGAASAASPTRAPLVPQRDYVVLVASESVDQIAFVRFGPAGIRVDRTSTMGVLPIVSNMMS